MRRGSSPRQGPFGEARSEAAVQFMLELAAALNRAGEVISGSSRLVASAYVGQQVGGRLVSDELGGFFGALIVTPIVLRFARR